ncbi:MAG TPA: hypothetical protein VFV51_00700, partial [Vicinamibacterales bacterium]|nr:hypothetical protein [Vicinamibacterales bacterium]
MRSFGAPGFAENATSLFVIRHGFDWADNAAQRGCAAGSGAGAASRRHSCRYIYATATECFRGGHRTITASVTHGVDGRLTAGPALHFFAMLDAFFGSSTNKKSQQDELQALIAQAKEERTLLSAMLTQMAGGTSKLAQTSKSLDQVGQKADAALKRLDELGQKVTGYEDRSRGLDQIEKRIAALLEQVHEAQRVSDKITAPDGELQKHRLAVNQLASQALENQATIETLRKERSSFEDLRALLKVSTSEVAKSVESVSALKSELDAIRSTGVQLTSEFSRIRDTSREAKDASMTAMDNVKEIEKKLGPLVQLQELSKNTEERLASLNALAEHVAQKAKALEA